MSPSSFSRWASLACCPTFLFFSVFLFLYILDLWTWQNINLSLILYTTRIPKHFPLSIFVFIDSFDVLASRDAGEWPYRTLSRQNNPTFGIDLHEVYVRTGGRAGQAGREKNEAPSFFSLPAACRLFSRGVIFTRFRVSLALLSLRKNGGLLVVYGQVYTVITKFSCFHRFPIHLSNGASQQVRARKFRCHSGLEYLTTLFYYKKHL